MLLNHQEINSLQAKATIFDPYDLNHVQGASYDLHIGEKVYISCSKNGTKGVVKLKKNEQFILPANGIFMFQTEEKVKIPGNFAGKLSLRMGLVRKGLMMPSQTQADPGYDNYLFGFIYNLSNEDIKLSRNDHVVSFELFKLAHNTDKMYQNDYNSVKFEEFVSNYIQSSLDFLSQKITKSQEKLDRSTTFLKVLSIIFTVAGIFIACTMAFLSFGPYFQLKESIKEVQAKSIALDEDYKKLVNKVNELEKTMIKYESQPRIGSEQSPGPNKKVK